MYWVENEFRVIKDWEVIINLWIWEEQHNILNVLWRALNDSSIEWVQLIPELDAQQWEIIVDANKSLSYISDQLAETLFLFEEVLKSFQAWFDQNVWIPNQLVTMLSSELYPELLDQANKTKYKSIDKKLKELWVRQHTNIIWMHLNISENNRIKAIERNIRVWKLITEELSRWSYGLLHISLDRLESYIQVTTALWINYKPITDEIKLLWLDWKPIENYTFNRLREYPNGDLWSELRFPDAITGSNDVHKIIEAVYWLYQ